MFEGVRVLIFLKVFLLIFYKRGYHDFDKMCKKVKSYSEMIKSQKVPVESKKCVGQSSKS